MRKKIFNQKNITWVIVILSFIVLLTATAAFVYLKNVKYSPASIEEESCPSSSDLSSCEQKEVESISVSQSIVTVSVSESKMPVATIYPEDADDKNKIWQSSDEHVATVDELGNIKGVSEGTCVVIVSSASNKNIKAEINVIVYNPVSPQYINGILIVNKTYPLPADYNPGTDNKALSAFNKMKSDAKNIGLNIYIASGFRSYSLQSEIYNNYVKRVGREAADTFSARPGHSEHQTGLAFDLNSIDESFTNTEECKWVNLNCYKYGFIIRYPKDKESITGYIYEPWHIRYVGVDMATKIYKSGLCLEEYFGITSRY